MKRRAIKHFLCKSQLVKLIRIFNHTPRVLFYHGVDHVPDDSIPTLHIEPEMFEKQMLYLSDYYEVISIDEYYTRFTRKAFTGKEIVITLDDGYRNNLTIATPILQSFNFPFTVFISTRHISEGCYFPTWIARAIILDGGKSQISIDSLGIHADISDKQRRNEILKTISYNLKHSDIDTINLICKQIQANLSPDKYQQLCTKYYLDAPMNWEEVKRLKETYKCTIGSHCLDHFICNSKQKTEEMKRQLFDSKKEIEKRLGITCEYLAYPNGDHISEAIRIVEKAGYKMAFTTDDRQREALNPYTQSRCPARFEFEDFAVKLALKPSN